jgi:hypothetical protein
VTASGTRAETAATPEGEAAQDDSKATAASPQLGGQWVLVPGRDLGGNGYPVESIQLSLDESGGILHGRYDARYHVGGRGISPSVTFQFEGHATGGGDVLPWIGPGDSKGEVALRLRSDGLLEVAWAAGRLGDSPASGTATLARVRR